MKKTLKFNIQTKKILKYSILYELIETQLTSMPNILILTNVKMTSPTHRPASEPACHLKGDCAIGIPGP